MYKVEVMPASFCHDLFSFHDRNTGIPFDIKAGNEGRFEVIWDRFLFGNWLAVLFVILISNMLKNRESSRLSWHP